MRKIGKRLAALLLVTLLSFGLRVSAAAEEFCTVTFYTDANMSTVYATQTVPHKGYAAPPATDPPSYSSGGFRYVFDRWYRHVDGNTVSEFHFSETKIRRDTTLFAGYTQYLDAGYTLIVNYDGGTDFISDTGIPVSQLMAGYQGVTWVSVVQLTQDDNGAQPSASPTPTAESSASPTPTATPSASPTPTAEPRPSPTPTASASSETELTPYDTETADTRETELPAEAKTDAPQKTTSRVVLLIPAGFVAVGACYLWFMGKGKRK